VAGLLGTVATQASKAMAHSISFGVNLAVTTNMLQFVWRNENEKRKEKRTSRRRPVLFVFLSIPLILLDSVRHVFQDGEMIGEWSSMYRDRCYHRDFRCLSLVGWICQLATVFGFGLLLLGVLSSSGAWVKVTRRFRELRGRGASSSTAA